MTEPDPYVDFTHPDYVLGTPTPKGIPYDPFMSPQKAGSLLVKVAFKSKNAATKTTHARKTSAHAKATRAPQPGRR